MGQPLDYDELGIGSVGYTLDEGLAVLASATLPQTYDCPHRTPAPIRDDVCNLCSLRGQPMQVYGCDLHGECTLHKAHSRLRSCAACPDRVAR